MEDTWTKSRGDRVVTYTTRAELGVGFVHTAKVERGDLRAFANRESTEKPTRDEVERLFVDFASTWLDH